MEAGDWMLTTDTEALKEMLEIKANVEGLTMIKAETLCTGLEAEY